MNNKFKSLFKKEKPIIGMIHSEGRDIQEKIKRAIKEIQIYQEEGVNGVIVENYFDKTDEADIFDIIKHSKPFFPDIVFGANILDKPYLGFYMGESGSSFIQFDSVQTPDLKVSFYDKIRDKNPKMVVLGGIRFKYKNKPTGNSLEEDLKIGMSRCDAIVTTGSGTGIETPLEKLKRFKDYIQEFPLIVGAGLNPENAYEQLKIADGAIVGSYFKPDGKLYLPVDKSRVRDLMSVVKEIRNSEN